MVDISRERLFELIWSQPATSIAQRLGISDVALGKLCRRLQIPKPPRGYWSRRRAGQSVQQPPLPAFIEESELEKESRRLAGQNGKVPRHRATGPRMSPRKRELFDHAVRHLRRNGTSTGNFTISGGRLTSIDPDFAAAVLVAVGQHYRRWGLPGGAGMRAEVGLEGVAARLVDDLLPLARDRVLVFSPAEPSEPRRQHWNQDQHAVVRFTPQLVRTVARLAQLVRNEGLAFIAHGLGSGNQFWRVRWASRPDRAVLGQTRLCVSASDVWVRYDGPDWLGQPKVLDTAAVALEQIAPIELLSQCELDVTAARARTHQEPYASRLEALQRAEQAFEIAEHARLEAEEVLEPESFMRAVALWWTEDQFKALQQVWNGLQDMDPSIERWAEALEHEREDLCREILGVRRGDSVSVASRGGRTRLRLEAVRLIFRDADDELVFLLHGARYRKDGLPGKRAEIATITVPWKQQK